MSLRPENIITLIQNSIIVLLKEFFFWKSCCQCNGCKNDQQKI